jgi:hypothetical protein
MEQPIVRKVSIVRKNPNPAVQFPRMPNLYLGLIENKDKVKQELVNREYVPPPSSALGNVQPVRMVEQDNSIPISTYLDELVSKKEGGAVNTVNAPPVSQGSIVSTSSDDEENEGDEEEENESSADSESESSDESESGDLSPPLPVQSKPSEENVYPPAPRPHTPHIRKKIQYNNKQYIQSVQPVQSVQSIQSPTEERFFHMQEPLQPRTNPAPSSQQQQTTSNLIRDLGQSSHTQTHPMNDIPIPTIPSLRELNMAPKTVPNLDYITSNVDEENNKRELLFKFELLKKSYKDANIPEFSMHSDYKTMKQNYENTVRRLHIDSSVENYKTYLIGGFMVVEYALGSWMGFDMQGFTQQQITTLTSYERLLVELGEKSYVDEESQWPVEVRLLGLIIMNAAFFIVSKLITKKTGSNILGIINSLNQAATSASKNNNENQKKRPMRGPNINLENIPNFI